MPVEYIAMMVPFAGICAGIAIAYYAIWTNHRRKMMDKQIEISAVQATQNASSVGELEQRVQVLERIITDSGFDISLKIEDLRDTSKTKRLN
jgi:hypothetical protein